MRFLARRPRQIGEIAAWLRRGEIGPDEAVRLAISLRRDEARSRTRPGAAAASVAAPATAASREQRVAAVLADLDQLVGLEQVKRHVREIHAYAAVGLRRASAGLVHDAGGLHMVFTGNPGTGKTTVARLLGRLFLEMGLLPQGHMVEVERADLVGEYIGHTAQKTREIIRRALGGVLFIDEAYSLARGGEKDFGKESIDVLVRAMEEHRGTLLLILAGYPLEMEWFLAQNPGLRSRFPILVPFPDYSADELLAIAEGMWRERQYELAPEARAWLKGRLSDWSRWAAGEEGNARAIRNLVERSLRCQALRLMALPQEGLTREALMAVTRADLERAASPG